MDQMKDEAARDSDLALLPLVAADLGRGGQRHV